MEAVIGFEYIERLFCCQWGKRARFRRISRRMGELHQRRRMVGVTGYRIQ